MKKENQELASENAQVNNNYELVDNGQFTYGVGDELIDGDLRSQISDNIKDYLFWGEDCEDDFVVYEGENGDYTLTYTFDWLNSELNYQITNEDGYCEGYSDADDYTGMYDRIDFMMDWLNDKLMEIDQMEWEKNNN